MTLRKRRKEYVGNTSLRFEKRETKYIAFMRNDCLHNKQKSLKGKETISIGLFFLILEETVGI